MSEGASPPGPAHPDLAPGKACGTCTMCCKVFRIPEVDKLAGQWCRHVLQGRGCGIHDTRPDVCRQFFCYWMQNGSLGPDWRPERSKFVLYREMKGKRLVVALDPSVPSAWRREPFYAQFKRWAAQGAAQNHQIIVFHGMRATAVLPDRDVDLGTIAIGDRIIYHVVHDRIEVELRPAPPAAPQGA